MIQLASYDPNFVTASIINVWAPQEASRKRPIWEALDRTGWEHTLPYPSPASYVVKLLDLS